MNDLSKAQKSALAALAVNHDLHMQRGEPKSERFTKPIGASAATLEALERRGLVKCNYATHGYCMAHITPAGYLAAASQVSA